MSELQERFQRWADELVDLTARNELINFKVTKTSTILPDPKGLSKLLNGDMVAITDLCDLTDPDQMKPAKGAIKAASLLRQNTGNLKALQAALGIPSVSKFQAQPTRNADNKAFVSKLMHHRWRPRNHSGFLDHLSSALPDGPLIRRF